MKKIISSILTFALMGIPMVSAAFAETNPEHDVPTQVKQFFASDENKSNMDETKAFETEQNDISDKNEKPKMSTAKKILITAGIVAALTGVCYAAYTYCPAAQDFVNDQAIPFLQGCGSSVKNFISSLYDSFGTTPDEKLSECQRQLNECNSSKITFFDKMTKFMLGETVFFLGSLANNFLIGRGAGLIAQLLLVKLAFF